LSFYSFQVESSELFMGEVNESADIDEEFMYDEEDSTVEYVDPNELSSMDEEVFSDEINKMVAEDAPRLFALCEEIGVRVDAGIVSWGLSFEDDHAELVHGIHNPRSRTTVICHSAERAREWFEFHSKKVGCAIRLVWVDQAQEQVKAALRLDID
jgi:hypothetical protein